MAQLDISLAIKYKNMIGLTNINNISGNTIFLGDTTITSNLNVSAQSKLQGSVSIMSSVYISGNTICNNNATIQSNLQVSNNVNINNNVNTNNITISGNTLINGSLNINNTAQLNKNTSFLSSLNIGGTSIVNNTIYTNNIAALSDQLNIHGNVINIGTQNSIINLLGTTTYIASTQLKITDKILPLNYTDNTGFLADSANCGIQILGISGNGFIQTSSDASRFLIKAPRDTQVNYISTIDNDGNLNISGTSTFHNNTTILSNLFISNNSIAIHKYECPRFILYGK